MEGIKRFDSTRTLKIFCLIKKAGFLRCSTSSCKMKMEMGNQKKIRLLSWSAIESCDKIYETKYFFKGLSERCSPLTHRQKLLNNKALKRRKSKHGKLLKLSHLGKVWVKCTQVLSCFRSAWLLFLLQIDRSTKRHSQMFKIIWVTFSTNFKKILNNNNKRMLIKKHSKLLILSMKSSKNCFWRVLWQHWHKLLTILWSQRLNSE